MRNLLRPDIAKIVLPLSLATFFLYLPIIVNPQILLNRGNDLQEFYWPIFYFIKESILQNHTIPLWNNMFFSCTPLLSDPGALLFYPLNVIFLFLPIDGAFMVSLIFHTFLGGFGIYLTAKKGFGFSRITSVITAIFYITFPRTAGFIEAGHLVFIIMSAWLPFVLLATLKLVKSPNFFWSAILAVSLSGLFFSFSTVFVMATIVVCVVLFLAGIFLLVKKRSPKTLISLILVVTLTSGFTANTFLPQLEWLPQTTRFILLKDRDVYPKWNGKVEFVKSLYPELLGKQIYDLDTEKWLAVGVFISILALIGFYKLEKKYKILVVFLVSGIVLISLNNVSPINSLLLESDWYVLGRVATRIWFVNTLIFVFLAGLGFETLYRTRLKKLTLALAFLTIIELITLSWIWIGKPPATTRELAPASVLDFLKSDPETFRVFCVTRCLSQQDVARNNLQTIEGYGTIYQKNYYDNFIQLSQVYWDRYSSTLPSTSIYKFHNIQPIASILGEANVKYVISPYVLKDKQFTQVAQFDKYLIFENTQFKTRAYFYIAGPTHEIEAPIIRYKPSGVVIDALKHKAGEIVFAETWSPGWKAKADGNRIRVEETGNKLMKVKIPQETKIVEFFYYPESYRLGKTISIFTLLGILSYFLWRPRRQKNFKRTRQ